MFLKKQNIKVLIIISIVFIFQAGCDTENEVSGKNNESCLKCHHHYSGLSGGHDPKVIGCTSCHRGNPNSSDKKLSHKDMIKIPGNLSNAHLTCSSTNCHPNELGRINNSLMSTNSGIVSIDRIAFGELNSSDTFFHIQEVKNSAADTHIKNLCYNCHLGKEKTAYKIIDENSRGGGCIACHLNYNGINKIDVNDKFHPTIDLNIRNDKCFGCHSRSSRISLSYTGQYETHKKVNELKYNEKYRKLKDGRILKYATADIHYEKGLDCIDCHPSKEIMGDGKKYRHSGEAVKIQCSDCHPVNNKFQTVTNNKFDLTSALDYGTRKYKFRTNKFISTYNSGIPLVNSYFDNKNKAYLIGKRNQKLHMLNSQNPICSNDMVHKNLDCTMCHTAWAPRCIACHTTTEKQSNGSNKWVEYIDDFGISPPVMGVKQDKSKYKIHPAIPGMIMTLDKSSFKGIKKGSDKTFFRFFSPVSAHTTSTNSRSCMSCHFNPESLGYGSGKFIIDEINTGKNLRFIPDYENYKYDGLPQDAWIGFLTDLSSKKRYSGHDNFSPLNLKLQKTVLSTGTCLKCHENNKDFKYKMIYGEYQNLKKKMKKVCKITNLN